MTALFLSTRCPHGCFCIIPHEHLGAQWQHAWSKKKLRSTNYPPLKSHARRQVQIEDMHEQQINLEAALKMAEAVLFVTGTYWDSWGSPLQKFLEDHAYLETSPVLMGKPAGAIVLQHFCGGKAVLSRLQGVLSTWDF